ncbi:MAG: hypothetical protein KKD39_03465, partial [Candidatus Altiarchaeota archaeon]|nr:hypothetical protein [Candidatus Altiarchaeota archaeon]
MAGKKNKRPKFSSVKDRVYAPWKKANEGVDKVLLKFPPWIRPWIRDVVDVGSTVLVIIVVLKLLFGADMLVPMVVVTSSSMTHNPGDMSWRVWLEKEGLNDNWIASFPIQSGFNMGDMIIVSSPKAGLGDIIIYERDLEHLKFSTHDPIIHRVVGEAYVKEYKVVGYNGTLDCVDIKVLESFVEKVKECQGGSSACIYPRYPDGGDFKFYITKGDNNVGSDQCNPRLDIAYPVTDAQVTGKALLRLPYFGWPKLILSIIWKIVTL